MKADAILSDFAESLERFKEAVETEPANDIHRAGCIQYFEFTFDLAWKSIQALAAYYGVEPVRSPRAAFKTAYAQGWIVEQEPWLEMLEARNRMSHVYNAAEALEVYEKLPRFLAPFKELQRSLTQAYQAA